LFNILTENPSQNLKKKQVYLFDYADDFFALCKPSGQVRSIIRFISDWNGRSDMQLNKKKSGVVIFNDGEKPWSSEHVTSKRKGKIKK